MNWQERKAERTKFYKEYVEGWRLRTCYACNGSGRYDTRGSPRCASCEGTGRERYKHIHGKANKIIIELHNRDRSKKK